MSTLEDMMDDLGLARAEEVASDGRDHRDFPHANAMPTLRRPQDDGSDMWQNAVRNGHFEDDDYNSVKLLDPLSNGNLHRQNRQIREVIGEVLEGEPHYDPTQPGYRGGRRRRPEPILPSDYHISKNGILLPPGMVTKRWEPGAILQSLVAQSSARPAAIVARQREPTTRSCAKSTTPALLPPAVVNGKPASVNTACDQAITDKDRHMEMLSVPRIEAVITDQNLHLPEAQECVQFVRGIDAAEFAEMTCKVQEMEVYLRHYYGPLMEGISILKYAAAQMSLMRLISRQSFEDLPEGEKWRALALVYRGVLLACQQRC